MNLMNRQQKRVLKFGIVFVLVEGKEILSRMRVSGELWKRWRKY